MLYSPKWEQQTETRADPFSLASLIAWLEKQPAHKEYDYSCNGSCLLALYFRAAGFKNVLMGAVTFDHGTNRADRKELPPHFNYIAIGHPRTFGAALERARAASRV